MRVPAISAIVLVMVIWAAGCGDRKAGTDAVRLQGYIRGDYDDDDNGGEDEDDVKTRSYGQQAPSSDTSAVNALVRRYYAAAAAEDGAAACALVDARLSDRSDFTDVVPKSYTPAAGSAIFQHKSCADVATILFEPAHQQIARDARSVRVIALRLDGPRGLAILVFTNTPESEIAVRREHGRWKIDGFLGMPLV